MASFRVSRRVANSLIPSYYFIYYSRNICFTSFINNFLKLRRTFLILRLVCSFRRIFSTKSSNVTSSDESSRDFRFWPANGLTVEVFALCWGGAGLRYLAGFNGANWKFDRGRTSIVGWIKLWALAFAHRQFVCFATTFIALKYRSILFKYEQKFKYSSRKKNVIKKIFEKYYSW